MKLLIARATRGDLFNFFFSLNFATYMINLVVTKVSFVDQSLMTHSEMPYAKHYA